MADITGRLEQQINFVVEVDKLKRILRQSFLTGEKGSERLENDAEHSWHLALMSFILQEYAPDKGAGLNQTRVIKMVLIHDLVEIDAGDTYCYDEEAMGDKRSREEKAAERIFNLLPTDQALEIRRLWDEFEENATPEARYAAALDRLQPILLNYHTEGRSWKKHGITAEQVLKRNIALRDGAPELWAYVQALVGKAKKKGYLL